MNSTKLIKERKKEVKVTKNRWNKLTHGNRVDLNLITLISIKYKLSKHYNYQFR